MSYFLLSVVVFAWGFSWYAIVLQIGDASALVAVTYRFILAAAVMSVGLIATGRWQTIRLRDQPWLIVMGACLFSMNFVSFYLAAHYLPSGLLSVIFATAAIFGAINAWIFMGKRPQMRVLMAGVLGMVGLLLLLWPQIRLTNSDAAPWWAFVLPFVGTYLFSVGNIASVRLSQNYALPNIVGQGMIWGAALLTVLSLALNEEFVLPVSAPFWAGVVYLALVSSLLAFLTYLTLVNRVGTARASYATVLFPIVAMLVSTWAEGYNWSIIAVAGLLLALGGTLVTFSARE